MNEQKNYYPREAESESKISATNLIEEIEPILDDYFHGCIKRSGEGLIYQLPNGQKFVITAVEIK